MVNICRRREGGFTVQELIVAVAVLMTVMTISTSMFFKVNQVWKDIRRHRLASCELNSQLDRLTRMSRQEVEAEIDGLAPSPLCAEALRDCQLTATLTEDQLGDRLTLSIQYPGKTLSLSAWLQPSQRKSEQEDVP